MSSVDFNITTVELSQSTEHLLNSSVAFNYSFSPLQQLTRLTSETSLYAGLLYTPTINTRCDDTQAVIPRNLTLQDLPVSGYPFIAFAPASNCRDSYVQQATIDGAKAIVLYPPTNLSYAQIPQVSIAFNAQIPVYFADYLSASTIALQMNLYNTNINDIPNGAYLSSIYQPDSYIRLALTVSRNGSTSRTKLPGLWIFLLVVLGLLCLIVASTSIAMHLHQYMARRDLRRRIAAGQVDLEGLGIKRLTVPKKHIDALTQRTWVDEAEPSDKHSSNSKSTNVTANKPSSFGQTSCSICLEDYQTNLTAVRVLPCHHIFHPDCIDPFLFKRSSLCPLCKQSVLPKGYIPPDSQLTAATVMRERRRRRQAGRSARTSPQELEMQPNGIAPVVTAAGLGNFAPDNEEEERELRSRGHMSRIWRTMFPARGI